MSPYSPPLPCAHLPEPHIPRAEHTAPLRACRTQLQSRAELEKVQCGVWVELGEEGVDPKLHCGGGCGVAIGVGGLWRSLVSLSALGGSTSPPPMCTSALWQLQGPPVAAMGSSGSTTSCGCGSATSLPHGAPVILPLVSFNCPITSYGFP